MTSCVIKRRGKGGWIVESGTIDVRGDLQATGLTNDSPAPRSLQRDMLLSRMGRTIKIEEGRELEENDPDL